MSIRSELLSLKHSDPQNILHVSTVVQWARENPSSDLHRSLEWDNERAAEAHRFWQVRQLIQVHVIADDGQPEVVSLSIDRVAGGGYRSLSDVVAAPDLREVLLADALAELERVKVKYQRVTELARVWQETENVRVAAASRPARTRRGSKVPA